MPVRLDLLENNTIVLVTSAGDLSRAETLYAFHKLKDLIDAKDVQCVLFDARDMDVVKAPSYSVEIIEAFIDIVDRPLPVAFLPPVGWTDAHFTAGWPAIQRAHNETGVFNTPELAMDWLSIQLREVA